MTRYLERLRLASWKLGQPLSRLPSSPAAVVSDLFIWRNNEDYKTSFELISLPSIFDSQSTIHADATIVINSSDGVNVLELPISFPPYCRQTLRMQDLIPAGYGPYGTFSIFHSHTPSNIGSLGSFLCERGYVGYQYRDSSVHSYAHGNLDAVARLDDYSTELLGSRSFRKRNFNLQCKLEPSAVYELALVNPVPHRQTVTFLTLLPSGAVMDSRSIILPPRGSYIFTLAPNEDNLRLVIRSNLVMARPLVFKLSRGRADVFHG